MTTELQLLVVMLLMLFGINRLVVVDLSCRYCGKPQTVGVVHAVVHDLFGITLCDHGADL